MDTFRIAIDSNSSQTLVKLLQPCLSSWHLYSHDRDGEIILRLIPEETTELRYSILAEAAVHQAVHIVSMAGSIPTRCLWTIRQRKILVVRISPQDRVQTTIFQTLAWALFLWAASRHPGHETFHGFVHAPLGQTHNLRLPSGDSNTSLAAFSQQTQPLSHPVRARSVSSSAPMSFPPTAESPPKKGG